VKSTTYGSRKAKNWKNGQSYGSNVNPWFFYGAGFSRLVAPNDIMPRMSRNHESCIIDDGILLRWFPHLHNDKGYCKCAKTTRS
jgi:hypothetical protein